MVSNKERTLVINAAWLISARISGDGRTIAYSDRDGNIYSIPSSGGGVKQLCSQCGTIMGVSFDGKLISYEPMASEDLTVYDIEQSKPLLAAVRPSNHMLLSAGQFSHDGQWIAFHSVINRLDQTQIWLVRWDPKRPAPPEEWIAITDGKTMDRDPVWAPNGRMVYFLSERDGFRCIWAQRLDASSRKPVGEPFVVEHFHTARQSLKRVGNRSDRIGLSVSSDRMVLSFGELTGNIWRQEKLFQQQAEATK